MTNPTTYRWIPAADKPGGLVFGDVVRHISDPNDHDAVVITNNGPEGHGYWACLLECDPFAEPDTVHESSLLVRIDEPAPLPESTEGRQILWLADAQETSLESSDPHEAAEFVADEYADSFDPMVVHLIAARRTPDIFAVVSYDHEKGEWESVSLHSSQADADAAKASLPTPTEAADGE